MRAAADALQEVRGWPQNSGSGRLGLGFKDEQSPTIVVGLRKDFPAYQGGELTFHFDLEALPERVARRRRFPLGSPSQAFRRR